MSEEKKQVFREEENESYAVPGNASKGAHLVGIDAYKEQQAFALANPDKFWDEVCSLLVFVTHNQNHSNSTLQKAKEYLTWFAPYTQVRSG
jgi:hypothetical protein